MTIDQLDRTRYAVCEYEGSWGAIHIVRDDWYRPARYAVAYKGFLYVPLSRRRSPWYKTHKEVLDVAADLFASISGMVGWS